MAHLAVEDPRFALGAPLTRGARSAVFAATWDGRPVAAKARLAELEPEACELQDAVVRAAVTAEVLRELRALRALAHGRVVGLVGVVAAGPVPRWVPLQSFETGSRLSVDDRYSIV